MRETIRQHVCAHFGENTDFLFLAFLDERNNFRLFCIRRVRVFAEVHGRTVRFIFRFCKIEVELLLLPARLNHERLSSDFFFRGKCDQAAQPPGKSVEWNVFAGELDSQVGRNFLFGRCGKDFKVGGIALGKCRSRHPDDITVPLKFLACGRAPGEPGWKKNKNRRHMMPEDGGPRLHPGIGNNESRGNGEMRNEYGPDQSRCFHVCRYQRSAAAGLSLRISRGLAPFQGKKQWIGFIFALGFFFTTMPALQAETLRFTGMELDTTSIRFSPLLSGKSTSMKDSLRKAFQRISLLFENPPARVRTVFWIVGSDAEMKQFLKDYLRLGDPVIERAVKDKAYADVVNVVLNVPPNVQDDWLLRLMATEFARQVMDAAAPTARDFRIGWFYNGTAAYLAWLVQGELDGNPDAVESTIMQYYGKQFQLDKVKNLDRLETPGDWGKALREEPTHTFAHAVLACTYLYRKKGIRSAVVILRVFDKEDAFQTGFERGTGMGLKEFEQDLRQNFYPSVSTSVKK